jgi:cytochrome c
VDGHEVNKIFGAVVGAMLIFLTIHLLTGAMFSTGGHGDDEALAYAIEIDDADSGDDEEVAVEAGPSIAVLLASADINAGAKVFKKCQSCHKVGDGAKNGTGPQLNNIIDRAIGGVEGYKYSTALAERGGVWDWESLDGFLEKPKTWAPGTKMGFNGLKKPKDRANVMAWLNAQAVAPVPLPQE